MTERLYYNDSFLYDFSAQVTAIRDLNGRSAVVLSRTAFYPTSGGQIFDTGWLDAGPGGAKLRVEEVTEDESGEVLHLIDRADAALAVGLRVRGYIDVDRRRDHMQQHSGQHVLSAAFVRLYGMQTVSFHMGDESCTIDLDAKALTEEQARAAEAEANRAVFEDLPVEVKYALAPMAREMGVRKIPQDIEGELRLVNIKDYDLNACGGTHVKSTGQIGPILLRKIEKVRQGVRVEFVCGQRAVATARKDYETLVQAAALFSTHIHEVPAAIAKAVEEVKGAARERKRLLEELAEYHAASLLREEEKQIPRCARDENSGGARDDSSGGARDGVSGDVQDVAEDKKAVVITLVLGDRDLPYIKLLAQKLTAGGRAIALLGTTCGQAGLVFAQTPGLPFDMGALMKEAMAEVGGRGGGTKDMAQGGVPDAARVDDILTRFAERVRG